MKNSKKHVALFLSVVVLFTTILSTVQPEQLKAASNILSADTIVMTARAKVGSHDSNLAGMCLRFCLNLYQSLNSNAKYGGKACCAFTYSKHAVISTSRENIPLGALVFFSGTNGRCSGCGYSPGHVGIYVGDGVVSIQGKSNGGIISNKPISTWERWGYPYIGWGYLDGVEVVQGGGGSLSTTPSITVGGAVYPTGSLNPGQVFGIHGTVYSTNRLSDVTASILNASNTVVQQKSVNPNATVYSLRGPINNAMEFNKLSFGSYRFQITATDVTGYTQTVINSSFSVGTISEPAILASDTAGGVEIRMSTTEGMIYYTLDGSDPGVSGIIYQNPIWLDHSATIKAVAKSGNLSSGVNTQSVQVHKLAAPTITAVIEENAFKVTIEAEAGSTIYYTTDGSKPNRNSAVYTAPLQLKSTKTIKAMAVKRGFADSDTSEQAVTAELPKTPSVTVNGADKIAAGDAVKIAWGSQEQAHTYLVKLYQDQKIAEEKTVQSNSCAFILPEAGEYEITVAAKNFLGSSAESYPPVKVTAMPPCTVTFADFDGKAISAQQVKYGYTAELPENPSRRGYEFKKWDNNAIYKAVVEDLLVKAEYTKKSYIVKFLDADGSVYAPQQEVYYQDSVILPKEPTIDKTGYAFMGWRCTSRDEESALDYEHVDADMTLQAVFDWGSQDLPVVIGENVNAQQKDGNSYYVTAEFTNWPKEKTYCKALVSLKTANGKMVKTVTQDLTLNAGETAKKEFELVCDKVATQVEINVVGLNSQKTAGAYAKAVTRATTSCSNTAWSSWSETQPPAGALTETKTMYRYRDKMYTQSASPTLEGWSWKGQTTSFGDWSGTYASTTHPGTGAHVRIVDTKTEYNYYHYCCNSYGGKTNNVDSIAYGSGKHYYHTLTTASPLPVLRMADQGGRQAYGGQGKCTGCPKNFYAWFLAGQTTTYYYQTRSVTTIFDFVRWGGWSAYSENPAVASDDRQIESAVFYRYQIPMETPGDQEETGGTAYTKKGSLSETALDLSGKRANILVYRSTNEDPTENQLEYVGQTEIGENNSYSFTFIPKEDPNDAKSNFIVALAIEGQTNLYNIDVIYADQMRYTVTFYDKNGKEISSVRVKAGESANAPAAPQEEGFCFLGWDKDITNIMSDRAVTARYKENEYTIVYADFENDTIDMLQLAHGSALPTPAVKESEGKRFLGWDKILDGTKTAETNMVLTARYEKKQCTVTFVDSENQVVSKQIVPYGRSAVLPPAVTEENKTFLGWSTDHSWWNVTGDITVTPVMAYEKTADTPTYRIDEVYMGGILSISAPKGQQVWYMLETEDIILEEEPENTESFSGEGQWELYTEEILLDCDTVIRFYAAGENMNNGNMIEIPYKVSANAGPYMQTAKIALSDMQAEKGDAVKIPIVLQENPGIRSMRFRLSYDTSAFSSVEFQKGDLITADGLVCNIGKDTGIIEIQCSQPQTMTAEGTLGILCLSAGSDAADGIYPLGFQYTQEETYDNNWMDLRLDFSGCSITVGNAKADKPSEEDKKPDDTAKPDQPNGKPGQTVPGKGETIKSGKTSYKVTKAKAEVSFAKASGLSGAVTVMPSVTISGITYKITGIEPNAFSGNEKITKVTIGSNVKKIGKNAFKGCSKLKTVSIGKNVTLIGENAFLNCKELRNVTIPNQVKTIEKSAFSGCKKLKTATIGTGLKTVGKNAFRNCKKLKTITIKSKKLKTIGKNAFYGVNADIRVPASKWKEYKKLAGGKKGYVKKI